MSRPCLITSTRSERPITSGTRASVPRISVTPADSTATADPAAPIAIPTVAAASATAPSAWAIGPTLANITPNFISRSPSVVERGDRTPSGLEREEGRAAG